MPTKVARECLRNLSMHGEPESRMRLAGVQTFFIVLATMFVKAGVMAVTTALYDVAETKLEWIVLHEALRSGKE